MVSLFRLLAPLLIGISTHGVLVCVCVYTQALRHPNIVGLVDIVEVDAHCFATVLDFCEGGDLDTLLRDHQVGCTHTHTHTHTREEGDLDTLLRDHQVRV